LDKEINLQEWSRWSWIYGFEDIWILL